MQQGQDRRRNLIGRLNEAAQDLNAILLVLAIGLAVLDFTCFFVLEVRQALPPGRLDVEPWAVATPATSAGQAASTSIRSGPAAGATAGR